jgi:hypothetical protein
MALSNFSDLQATVASFLHRSDLTSEIQDFIRLAESDLQVRAKLSQWDTSATVSLTSGSGALPSDFASALSCNYGSQTGNLQFIPKDIFAGYSLANTSGEPLYYTIEGASLKVAPAATGDATLRYTARFTPLSSIATTNSLLTLFPDAYLNGALMQASSWLHDAEAVTKYAAFFESSMKRVKSYVGDYKYPYALQMRAA